jgi:hypothetical protein
MVCLRLSSHSDVRANLTLMLDDLDVWGVQTADESITCFRFDESRLDCDFRSKQKRGEHADAESTAAYHARLRVSVCVTPHPRVAVPE